MLKYFKDISFIALAVIIIAVTWTNFNLKRWKKQDVIKNDVVSYYAYLPAYFIYDDLSLSFLEGKEEYYHHKQQFWPEKTQEGNYIIKTTMGMSFLYAPFFLIAYLTDDTINEGAPGFSSTYHKYIHLSSLFYFILGIFFLRKVLLRYFNRSSTAIALISIAIGTNLLYYTTAEAAMSHAYNFSLSILFIFLSILWHEKMKIRYALLLGLIGGLIVLIRPTNIIMIIFPLLLHVKDKETLLAKINLFKARISHLLVATLIAFLVILPQLIYWKSVSGNYLFNSYVGERFYFTDPQIIEGLFSYRKGWLTYTPIMGFAIIGLITLFRKHKAFFLPISLMTIIAIYVVFSWWCWWYGGSFGMRPMIDFYGFLAIPLCAFFHTIITQKTKVIKTITLVLALVLIGFNIFQMQQYRGAIIHWDGMTKEAYWYSFGKYTIDDKEKYEQLIDRPDYKKAKFRNENE